MSKVSRLSALLGLPDTGQDWGIEHADPDRLEEFVALAESLEAKNSFEPEALAELIFQSAQEAMEVGELPAGLRSRIVSLLRTRGAEFPATLEYWHSLSCTGESHISSLLQDAGHAA